MFLENSAVTKPEADSEEVHTQTRSIACAQASLGIHVAVAVAVALVAKEDSLKASASNMSGNRSTYMQLSRFRLWLRRLWL